MKMDNLAAFSVAKKHVSNNFLLKLDFITSNIKKILENVFPILLIFLLSVTHSHPTRRLFALGQGDCGQLGLGSKVYERHLPTEIKGIPNAKDIKAGGMHSICLTEDGEVYTFGCNDEGALGRETHDEQSEFEPGKVNLPGKCVQISVGDSHSACILDDGRAFIWGSFRSSNSKMSMYGEKVTWRPQELIKGTRFQQIQSGVEHIVALTDNGHIFTFGCGEQGQLGRGTIEFLYPGILYYNHRELIADNIWTTPYCTFIEEKDTRKIFAFGLNNYCQLGLPYDRLVNEPTLTALANVKSICGGLQHTLVLKNNGNVYCIGRKDYGRLGVGRLADDLESFILVEGLKHEKVIDIACGDSTSFALCDNGRLYTWGMGTNYQIGNGTDKDIYEPQLMENRNKILKVSSGGQHTLFIEEA
jgi:regulator of chromosome condensation